MIQCNFIKPVFTKCSAVYDTGAQQTCMPAMAIDPKLSEEDFKDADTITVGGIIKDESGYTDNNTLICYRMPVRDFYLGNIHITGVDIWVTFDERITDSVVGMDILSRVTRLGIALSGRELFFKDIGEMIDYNLQLNRNIKECVANLEAYIMEAGMVEEKAMECCKNNNKYSDFEIEEAIRRYKSSK